MDHLRYSGASSETQRSVFLDMIWRDPLVREALVRASEFALPDWWLVSGALYNTIWNTLTGRPSGYGIKDIDLFYFDDRDLSWEAEDVVIKRGAEIFAGLAKPVEIRNQARVHLWFESRFGEKRAPLRSSPESLEQFASRTHAVGARLNESGRLELCAPYGLEDIFAFRIVPNHALNNRLTHEAKAARAKAMWPQITIIPW